ncbi:hypothetical protein ACH4UM_04195 [Streptomyces sp. NPDC020801]|uniref:hypothetical protein n=1 Tax=unclassified Streptomyces TaxID=2593676 RepID=UPI003799DBAB
MRQRGEVRTTLPKEVAKHHPVHEVDVPIRDPRTNARGIHVLTGTAATAEDAFRAARHVYAQALHRHRSGDRPPRRTDGWSAGGLRPGWEPDWNSATSRPWTAPDHNAPSPTAVPTLG